MRGSRRDSGRIAVATLPRTLAVWRRPATYGSFRIGLLHFEMSCLEGTSRTCFSARTLPLGFAWFHILGQLVLTQFIPGHLQPRGLQAARKLRIHRRDNRWADKQYKKRALGCVFFGWTLSACQEGSCSYYPDCPLFLLLLLFAIYRTAYKHLPFQGASHAKGIVLEKMSVLVWSRRVPRNC